MHPGTRFARGSVVDIDAAVVGISRDGWTTANCAQEAHQIMRECRYDVVPIAESGGETAYFQATVPGKYDQPPERRTVHASDKIPYTTPLRYVICKFATESRRFYFLDDGENVVGLISVANLNCRQVKTYLHELLSSLESRLCNLLRDDDESAIREALGRPNKAIELYEEERAVNAEVCLLECMYLSDLIKVVGKAGRFAQLGFTSRKQFEKLLGPLNSLRDNVMHAERPIVGSNRSPLQLWELIKDAEDLAFGGRESKQPRPPLNRSVSA